MSAAEVIARHAPGLAPRVGLVLGSGLGPVADAVEAVTVIPYADLPGFPVPKNESHAGRLVLGRLSGVPVACMMGRGHLYEGYSAPALAAPVRALRAAGCRSLLVTNAAGGIDPALEPGDLMAIADHINLTGANPLTGDNDDAIGPRFPAMNDAYDPDLRRALAEAGRRCGMPLREGVYLAVAGPSFETPAEIRAFATLGAHAVGMSTVPEVIAARHCGLKVAGLSLITNRAAGLASAPPTAEEVLETAARAADATRRLVETALPAIDALS